MKLYETTIIFDPGLEEARVNEEVERVTQSILGSGGEVAEVQRWGKRKLAYMIKKRRDGTYVHVKHRSPAPLIAEMDQRFRLNESVLRHLTVVAPKESPKTEEAPKTGAEGAETAERAAAPAGALAPARAGE